MKEKVMTDDRAGAGEGPDAGEDGRVRDDGEDENPTKVQDAAKAGREDFDPNAGSD